MSKQFSVAGQTYTDAQMREANDQDDDFILWMSNASVGDVYPTFHGEHCARVA